MPPPRESSSASWFAAEVQPHEPALRGYLRGAFPAVRDFDDVVQESLLRVWRARAGRPIASAKAFLFTVARRLALDHVRREAISPLCAVEDLRRLAVLDERPDAVETISTQDKIRLLSEAVGSLPTRCRTVIILHKIQGRPQREVAVQLGISEKTVENHVALGVRRCEEFFRRRGLEYF